MRKILMAGAAVLVAAAGITPAAAGGGHGHGYGHSKHGHGYDSGYWRYDGYRGAWGGDYYGDHRHYRYKRHHGGLSGAEAGLIAAGIVGLAIVLDSASDRRGYDGYDRRYDYDRYDRRYDDRYDRSGRDDFYYRRDDRRGYDDRYSLDDRLLGGRAAPGDYNYGAAYNDCKAETRDAARREGLTVGLPAKPDDIDAIEGGEAVRFVTKFQMQDRGRAFTQTMVCEVDSDGVRFLELV
jgi:hypothetical protein